VPVPTLPNAAARLGLPVLHGPHVFNFSGEYDELNAARVARMVADEAALAAAAAEWFDAPEATLELGAKAQRMAELGAGAFEAAKIQLAPLLTKAGFHAPT